MSLASLTAVQRALLQRARIDSVPDLILTPVQDAAKKCRISPLEIKHIVDVVCRSKPIVAPSLDHLLSSSDTDAAATCTSGDPQLDAALGGGGLRSGMLWEVVGESAAGKTQLALRMSLLVQLSPRDGGLAGSTCYLLTSGNLPTSRLLQISENHPLLASSGQSSLDDIHTMPIPTVDFLIQALEKLLPNFIQQKSNQHHSDSTVKPVRMIVIDALGELFHSSEKTSAQTLIHRSQKIAQISISLHSLASTHGIIILVLNEVVEAFERQVTDPVDPSLGLSYVEQSPWFSRAHSIPGEERKEASLGLAWANQVNARIMMSRTGRRRFRQFKGSTAEKRQRTDVGYSARKIMTADLDHFDLVRRISVIFSSVSAPASLDYVIDSGGITIVDGQSSFPYEPIAALPSLPDNIPSSQVNPLDVSFAEGLSEQMTAPNDEDEWEAFWESDPIADDVLYLVEVVDPGGKASGSL
ncbi:hypothetical protein D9757_008277 [Collybiopsis confluens]|uniref:RecA family profile 1 domain-containing protein n=1 Tax=Collybiopsis confluens TaxID=2823264 RepID=A0A8H5H4D1_9AGAR|nr:hypothetical protein D9757_008277 [Collybiopsis confluens]